MKNMNINLKLSKSKRTNGSTFYRSPDISKIKALGYKQKISLDNGIKKILVGIYKLWI